MGRGIRHKAKARRQTTVEMDTSESDADMEASGLDSNAIEISERVYPETSYGGDSGRCVAKDHQGIALEVDDSGSDADIEAGGDDPEVIELSEHECTESTHDDDSDPGSISMYYDERGVLESKNSGLFETILDHYQPSTY